MTVLFDTVRYRLSRLASLLATVGGCCGFREDRGTLEI